jgi:hypothetical protein
MSDNANTGTFTDYPALEDLARLVKNQRRTTAAQIRITNEDKALRDQMRALLDAAGAELVTVNGYEVWKVTGRDGRPTVRVSPVRA